MIERCPALLRELLELPLPLCVGSVWTEPKPVHIEPADAGRGLRVPILALVVVALLASLTLLIVLALLVSMPCSSPRAYWAARLFVQL